MHEHDKTRRSQTKPIRPSISIWWWWWSPSVSRN